MWVAAITRRVSATAQQTTSAKGVVVTTPIGGDFAGLRNDRALNDRLMLSRYYVTNILGVCSRFSPHKPLASGQLS